MAAPCVVCNGAGVVASCPSCRLAFAPPEGELCPFCNSTPWNLSVCNACNQEETNDNTND